MADKNSKPAQLVVESSIDATIIRFQRARGSEWERGIAILADAGTSNVAHIVDMNLQLVPVPVWEYHLAPHEGTMTCLQIVGL